MRLNFALLLSEAKGELRFYKNEVLKDVLYYRAYAFNRVLAEIRGCGRMLSAPTERLQNIQPHYNFSITSSGLVHRFA